MSPVCFNNAIESGDPIFRTVCGATDHQIPAIRRLEEERNLKSQYSFAEVRVAVKRTIPVQILHVQALWFRRTIPTGTEVVGRQDFPAVLIRYRQWQTSIWKPAIGIIHPSTFSRCWTYWCEIILVYLVSDDSMIGSCCRIR